MQRVIAGVVLFGLAGSSAEARKRPWDEKPEPTIATVIPDVTVEDPNARAEAERQRAIDYAFIAIDLAAFSDSPGTMATKPDPALLVALRGAPPIPSERAPDKVYLSAPAAPTK
jgi:hypothetical protein